MTDEKRVVRIGGLTFVLPKMQKYRKKPVVVEATRMGTTFSVETLEGVMTGKPGDYLIRGIKGELYPCDAEVFKNSYDTL